MASNRTGEFRVGRGLTDWLYSDVDGTLLIWPPPNPGGASPAQQAAAWRVVNGEPPLPGDERMVPRVNALYVEQIKEWMRRRAGAKLVVWTMGGEVHARMAMLMCGLDEFGDRVLCVAKPDMTVDDSGDGWSKVMPQIKPESFKCPKL